MSTVTDTVEKYLTEKYNDSFTFDSYETTAYFTIKKFNRIYRKVQIVKIKFLQTQAYCISNLTKNLTITMLSKSHRRYFKKITHPEKPRCVIGALEETRTPDLLIRSQTLYPIALWVHISGRRDSNPRPPPWQGDVLPLNYFRMSLISYSLSTIINITRKSHQCQQEFSKNIKCG